MCKKKMFWEYVCDYCGYTCNTLSLIKEHLKRGMHERCLYTIKCTQCSFIADKEKDVFRHSLIYHRHYKECKLCDKMLCTKELLLNHLQKHYDNQTNVCKDFIKHDNLFNRVLIKRLNFDPYEEKSVEFLIALKYFDSIKAQCDEMLKNYKFIKTLFVTHCYFEKIDMEGVVRDNCVMKVNSGCLQPYKLYDTFHFKQFMHKMLEGTLNNIEKIETQGSGLVMRYITNFDIRFYVPCLAGGCQFANKFDTLQKFSYAKKFLVDVTPENTNRCFLYALAAGKILQENPKLAENLKALQLVVNNYIRVNFTSSRLKGIEFPFHIKETFKLEKRLKALNIAVNIWTIADSQIFTLYQSKMPWNVTRVDLLLHQSESDSAIGHYTYITSAGRFLKCVKNLCLTSKKKHRFSRERRLWAYCDKCASIFTTIKQFKSHVYRCKNPNGQKIAYAQKGEVVEYDSSARRQCKVPYIGFLDFEAKMEKVTCEENYKRNNCENCREGGPVRRCNHSEREIHIQSPMTYSFYIFGSNGKMLYEKTFSSDNGVMEDFFKMLQNCEEVLKEKHNEFKQLHWSKRLNEIFRCETHCWICGKVFVPGDTKYKPVPDHCHITPPTFNEEEKCLESKYLGAAHAMCNFQRQSPKHIPIYVHNFMSYDSNFILKHLDIVNKKTQIKCMPYNSNKLRTLTLNKWKFLDSYQMLSGSLADLVNNLSQDEHEFSLVKQGLSLNLNEINLCTQKAAYPYEWVKSVKQLKSVVDYPPFESFYSELKGDNISKLKYEEGKKLYKTFKFKNMLEYTEFYCKLDTLLLAEVMFSFRKTIYDAFNLAIENYISLPQLSFDACLKTLSGSPIEKLHDPAMVTMLEKNIRGGVSFVNNRHEKVIDDKNECMLYIDANNLYGWAQKMFLPTGNYKWVPSNKIKKLDWLAMKPDQLEGFIIEADLHFPKKIHRKLDNLPLAPEHETINYDSLSPFSKRIQKNLLGKARAYRYKQVKLVTSLKRKKRYVLHYLNLQLYLKLGVKVKKIHNVMSFQQRDVLKTFINFASKMRAQSKTKFAMDLWKRLSNSLYGKFIQDVRKYSKVLFVDNEKKLGRLINNVYFKDVTKINKNVCMVHMHNEKLKLDRLYAIGFTILELSKFFMYTMWYQIIKPRFGKNASLILTDTDSFVIKFTNHSKPEALEKLKDVMDFSNFPKDSSYFNDTVKKVPGYFKDEYPTGLIREAVNVRSKCYYLDVKPDPLFKSETKFLEPHIVCKGISHNVSCKFPIQLYKSCIYSKKSAIFSTMVRIKAKKQKIATTAVTKQTMSSGDDKRFQTCSIHSHPYGSIYSQLAKKQCIKCLYKKKNKLF